MLEKEIILLLILDSLRVHLTKSKFLIRSYNTEISPSAALTLRQLSLGHYQNLNTLAVELNLTSATISRNLKELAAKKLIKNTAAGKRASYLLTANGEKLLRMQDKFNEDFVLEKLKPFSKQEALRFHNYMSVLARQNKHVKTASIDDLVQGIIKSFRQLSINHDVAGASYLGSNYSAFDWVFLSAIKYDKFQLISFSEESGVPPAILTKRVKNFLKLNFLKVMKSATDARSKIFILTNKGQAALEQIEACALQQFSKDLEELKLDELRDFERLLVSYCGAKEERRCYLSATGLSFLRVQTAEDLSFLRNDLIDFLKEAKGQYPLGWEIFAPHNLSYSINFGTQILGAIELKKTNETFEIINLYLKTGSEKLDLKELQKIFSSVLNKDEQELKKIFSTTIIKKFLGVRNR